MFERVMFERVSTMATVASPPSTEVTHQPGGADRKTSFTTSRDLSEYRAVFSCLVCIESYTKPRALACRHVFCEQCIYSYRRILGGLRVQHDLCKASITCPICRKVTDVSMDGTLGVDMSDDAAASLLPNSRKVSMVDSTQRCDACVYKRRIEPADYFCSKCNMNYCEQCKTAHDQHQLLKAHTIIHMSSKDTFNLCCDPHGRQICQYFCSGCNVPCCTLCILEEHKTHDTNKLRDALSARRDTLKTLLNEFAPKLDRLEAKARRLSRLMSGERSAGGETEGESVTTDFAGGSRGSSSSIGELPDTPDSSDDQQRPINGVTEIHSTNGEHGRAMSVSFNLRSNINHLPKAESFKGSPNGSMNGSLNGSITGSTIQDYSRERSASNSNLSSDCLAINILTNQIAHIRKLFELSTRLLEQSQSKKLLAVYEDVAFRIRTVLDPEMQELDRGLTDFITHELYASAVASTRSASHSSRGIPFSSSTSDLEGSACSISSSSRTRHSSGISNASTSLLPTPDSLDLEFPLPSMLIRPKLLWKVEKQRSDMGELWNPSGAAFLPDGGLIVAEYDVTTVKNNKLRVFDSVGRSLSVLARGQIQPLGVCVTREENIAVTDCKGKRVKILTLSGNSVIDIGKGQFGWPYGIATNSRNQLVVTDAFSDCISLYSIDGKRIRQFGTSGTANTQFRNPYHVAVDARDNIYVSDCGNNCIKVFDCNGRHIFTTSETGVRRSSSISCSMSSLAGSSNTAGSRSVSGGKQKKRKLKNPHGLAIDLKGNILVADDYCRVCMFDPTGRYVRNILTDEDSVRYPEVVFCSTDGKLVVTEWNPNNMFAVKVFTLYENAS